MNFGHLAIFHAVASTGSVTRAADRLSISQPAVSKQLAQFERSVGSKLFDREARGVRLTDAGRTLAIYSAKLFELAAEAERAVRDASFVRSGRVEIGTSPTIGAYVLPRVLVHLRRRFPSIEATAEVSGPAALATLVRDRAIDVAVTHVPLDGDIACRPFASEPLIVVAPPRHPIARRRTVTPRALAALPFVLREAGHITRVSFESALSRHGATVRNAIVLSTAEAVKRAVIDGLGVAVLPESAARDDLVARRLSRVAVAGFDVRISTFVSTLAGRQQAKATTAFLCLLKHGIRGSLPSLPTPPAFA